MTSKHTVAGSYSTQARRRRATFGESPYSCQLVLALFFLKRYGSFLVCRLLDPHAPRLGEEGVREKTKMTTMISPEGTFQRFSSARDGSDTGDETATLLFLIHLSGGLGRHERMNRPTSVLLMLE